jgi:multidrug efflux system membrane fusion protein
MHQGAPLTVEAWDRSDSHRIATGRLTSVDNQIDTTTGTIKLRADFANPHDELYPNQFVNARLLVTTLKNQTLLPTSAIQHNGTQAYVFLFEPGPGPKRPGAPASSGTLKAQYHVVMRDVTTGVTDRGMTAVQGVKPGDMLADSSFQKLIDGTDIYISHAVIPNQQTTINGESSAP